MSRNYIGVDLGAESGRIILGRLSLDELHRFANAPVRSGGSLHWDTGAIVTEIKRGLQIAGELSLPIKSVSCDSWGLDYFLFDESGEIISPTFHYRDKRCPWPAQANSTIPC